MNNTFEFMTEYGKNVYTCMKHLGMGQFYNILSGNAQFTKDEYDYWEGQILFFLETFPEYGVIRQSIEEYGYKETSSDGYLYFVTNFGFEDASEDQIVIMPISPNKN